MNTGEGIIAGITFIIVGVIIVSPNIMQGVGMLFIIAGAMLFTYHLKNVAAQQKIKKYEIIDVESKRI